MKVGSIVGVAHQACHEDLLWMPAQITSSWVFFYLYDVCVYVSRCILYVYICIYKYYMITISLGANLGFGNVQDIVTSDKCMSCLIGLAWDWLQEIDLGPS